MIYLGSDHGGFKLKEKIKDFLNEKGIEFEDLGTKSEESVDYPDYAKKVAEKVAETCEKGILICGTGIGMSIAANKVKGIRAALIKDTFTGEMSAKHNNANIVCLGGRNTEEKDAIAAINAWISNEFEKGRHERRVEKINELDDCVCGEDTGCYCCD